MWNEKNCWRCLFLPENYDFLINGIFLAEEAIYLLKRAIVYFLR